MTHKTFTLLRINDSWDWKFRPIFKLGWILFQVTRPESLMASMKRQHVNISSNWKWKFPSRNRFRLSFWINDRLKVFFPHPVHRAPSFYISSELISGDFQFFCYAMMIFRKGFSIFGWEISIFAFKYSWNFLSHWWLWRWFRFCLHDEIFNFRFSCLAAAVFVFMKIFSQSNNERNWKMLRGKLPGTGMWAPLAKVYFRRSRESTYEKQLEELDGDCEWDTATCFVQPQRDSLLQPVQVKLREVLKVLVRFDSDDDWRCEILVKQISLSFPNEPHQLKLRREKQTSVPRTVSQVCSVLIFPARYFWEILMMATYGMAFVFIPYDVAFCYGSRRLLSSPFLTVVISFIGKSSSCQKKAFRCTK